MARNELMLNFELEIPDDIEKDMPIYVMTIFLAVPMMAILGLWVTTTVYGALILSTIAGGMLLIASFSPVNDDFNFTTRALSSAVVFLLTWGPLAIAFQTSYFLYIMMYTSVGFCLGIFTVVKWYSGWRNIWKNILGGVE